MLQPVGDISAGAVAYAMLIVGVMLCSSIRLPFSFVPQKYNTKRNTGLHETIIC
jgi:hypothetical protein